MKKQRRERDEELRRVYRTHVRAVYAFLAYTVSADVAEDLTSETFERVIKAWDSFDARIASERTWILTIARNALMDHYRRQRLRNTVSTDEHPAILGALATSSDPLATQLSSDAVVEWLKHLAPRDQEVVALRFGADLSAREVAAITGLTEGNVHQLTSRALRRLRAVAAGQPHVTGSP